MFTRLAHRCWAGELEVITHDNLLAELQADETLSPAASRALTAVLADTPTSLPLRQAS